MQNETIKTICHHRSIRAYQATALTQAQITAIVSAAQSASSSNFLQCGTIIRITDVDKRKQLAHYAGDQSYVTQAPEFWVFCADFNRHFQIDPSIPLEKAEQLLVGCIDTALMAQNAVIAAESLGLGTVYIGGLRNNIDKVTALLELPKYVLPLFGLCLGYPAQDPQIKPRLPKQLIFFENSYQPIDRALLTQYDKQMHDYYGHRDTNQKGGGWSDKIAETIVKGQRDFILDYLHRQGWIRK
ncbi:MULTISPECIES: oxygen-insensitive NADPH nitroreductase [unclassified Gilliamella]|uniref:oxygen-insensitive NADPH nitroreductase n=1 Tax=unclassified Gilliamella TaxID=2685620 RepID=UPI002269D895|nr:MULTISPECIES: oxygen-insensitive NADPH nitroreductase [unclassified Gilliamella]MCX8601236.1 oxygen-insensitive NADPH nitroreductase [Gilliamella sp. B3722]MCX8607390.1 oxygen-insensitive NADPH nitroreductase [Gilliamella sp. B3771]MCX8610421.1 oxygen-insensitive NADPH nitroreductase [Gilliamella sp. B3891]MCX8612910.1 oxygen-insensitive NADPH nitroreductase [Gilliamella sp. B3773]MCX8614819.1 oxygen-insensitive NADPH nitroreductase [Gilliamella sp. B3770]